MVIEKSKIGTAAIANYWQNNSSSDIPWQLRWKPVCASTEINLSQWLLEKPLSDKYPRAFIAGRQTYGKGQRGRVWLSPRGGIWISAALPCLAKQQSVGLFGLAVALALTERLENRKIPAQIKWPNDVLVYGKKVIGLLPSLIYRGHSFRYARVGIGLNVCNKVPKSGISLSEILGFKSCNLSEWAGEILLALDRARYLFDQEESFALDVQKRFWAKEFCDPNSGDIWSIEGVDHTGALKLRRNEKEMIWRRW